MSRRHLGISPEPSGFPVTSRPAGRAADRPRFAPFLSVLVRIDPSLVQGAPSGRVNRRSPQSTSTGKGLRGAQYRRSHPARYTRRHHRHHPLEPGPPAPRPRGRVYVVPCFPATKRSRERGGPGGILCRIILLYCLRCFGCPARQPRLRKHPSRRVGLGGPTARSPSRALAIPIVRHTCGRSRAPGPGAPIWRSIRRLGPSPAVAPSSA
jgi:hypothetical protein